MKCLIVIDATGKPGSNIEGGNIVWIGSLSECLDIRAVDNTTEKYLFKGQYSIVVFIPPGPVRQVRGNTAEGNENLLFNFCLVSRAVYTVRLRRRFVYGN